MILINNPLQSDYFFAVRLKGIEQKERKKEIIGCITSTETMEMSTVGLVLTR